MVATSFYIENEKQNNDAKDWNYILYKKLLNLFYSREIQVKIMDEVWVSGVTIYGII